MIQSNTRNPAIQKVADAVYELSADEVLQEQIWVREKVLNDYNNDMTVARKEGHMEMLKQMVEDGVLTVSQTAEQINMTTDEFLSKPG